MKGPFINILDYKVETHPTLDVVMAVFLHEGQTFYFYLEAGQALALSGELEAAYQDATAKKGSGS